ncbi:MAG: 2-C-methyl-D-erythritol 4-phosphate cytidylyltransferase [Clostridiales bacterium]|nr:2-C-methyl-D-erythritol 4-phosphate cytidylyltransferase [Clostridiales bacterium]
MVIAGIVAGGVGSRMVGSAVPKQFLEVDGRPILIRTAEAFFDSPDVDGIVIGVHPDWIEYLESLLQKFFGNTEKIVISAGGGSRNETIQKVLRKAEDVWGINDDALVLTHDAVRPFVSQRIIHENVEAVRKWGICNTVIPATDTIVRSADGSFITDVPARNEMYQSQTPQSFRYGLFEELCAGLSEEELETATDISGLFCRRGYRVAMVQGDITNFKITYPNDMRTAESMMTFEEHGGFTSAM